MAKSYTELRNLFGTLTNNDSSTNLALGDQLVNDAIRRICASFNWPWLEKTASISTTASTQFYSLPNDYDRLIDVTVTIGSNRYSPIECPSRDMWDRLNLNTSTTSDTPEYFFIFNNQVGFYPIPASTTSNAITISYRRRVANLSLADYSTGNVSALTNGATAVTGSGTTWTTPMGGRWIKITPTTTAGQSGDGMWYEVASVGSATTLTLSKAYAGTTITGNTAFVLGEMSVLPESYQDLPVYWAAFVYFSSVQPEVNQAGQYKSMYEEMFGNLKRDYSMKSSSPVMDDGTDHWMINPNLTVSNIGS